MLLNYSLKTFTKMSYIKALDFAKFDSLNRPNYTPIMTHVILGAGGAIGNALTQELIRNKQRVKLVSRHNIALDGTKHAKADLLNYHDTEQAIMGADVVYLCVGLPYDTKIWKEQWPIIIQNTLNACKKVQAKLIFFDNVYMYGKVNGAMTENTPYNPCSKKGEVRAQIAEMIDAEYQKNDLHVISARAADLYGPFIQQNSVPFTMAIDKALKHKTMQWLLNTNKLHAYSYTLDCAKALYLLSSNDQYFNQTWHLPTQNKGITGKEFITEIADVLSIKNRCQIVSKWMIKLASPFNPILKELNEMLYQYQNDYIFDSSKFEAAFHFSPTPYDDGIRETIEFLQG